MPGKYYDSEFGTEHEHPNIVDFTKYVDKKGDPLWTLQDYLFILQNCKVFISCDAGIWPIAGAMKKNLVFCNVACIFNPPQVITYNGDMCLLVKKPEVINWLPTQTTTLLTKKLMPADSGKYALQDNTAEEIIEATKRFL